MPTSGRRSTLWLGCISVISAVTLLVWQNNVMATEQIERERADIGMEIEANFTMPELIVVPEPDPALYGTLLLDQAMAQARLVPLGK